MAKLCYQNQKDADGNKVVSVAISNITVAQIIELVEKEFPELGPKPNPKRIGVTYKDGFFGIRKIEESGAPYHIP